MAAPIPEPWASRMVERGFVDQRAKEDIPSLSALAREVGVHPSTISGVIFGRAKARAETVAGLADALGPEVQDWLGVTVELGPYVPPPESALLTHRQREAITALIRSIATESRSGSAEPPNPT